MPQPNSNPLIDLNESLQFKPKTEEYRGLIDLRHRENLDKLKPQIKTIKDALATKGLNNTAIAGVIGSLYQESIKPCNTSIRRKRIWPTSIHKRV